MKYERPTVNRLAAIMKKYILIILTILLFYSCQDTKTSDNKVVQCIISNEYKNRNKNGECLYDTKGEYKYGHFNYIFTDSNVIYVHRQNDLSYVMHCEITDRDSLLSFLELKPSHFQKILSSNLQSFLDSTLSDSIYLEERERKVKTFVTISSANDTIYDKGFATIQKMLEKNNIQMWNIRFLTEEERVVLNCIQKNCSYDPSKIIWASEFKPTIEFSPPIIDK